MPRDVRLDEALGRIVLGWRSSVEGLLLRVDGDEVRLVCRCGRSHWIVHENTMGDGASLVLVCHHCGTRAAFEMGAVRTAAP